MPMRQSPNRIWFILLLGAALAAIAGLGRFMSGQERIPWRDDFAAANRESVAVHKPVFAYFTAAWCEPCQSLRHTTWADAAVAKALSAYVPVKIDIDAHPDLAARYAPSAIPTFVVLKEDGSVVKSETGALMPEEFLTWLNG
jgi:thioredoxin-like negative regulator of GroEL